jgi:hypothetical protein
MKAITFAILAVFHLAHADAALRDFGLFLAFDCESAT